MTLDLLDEDTNVGLLRFKISKRRYVNEGVRRKERVLVKLDISEDRFLVVE